MNVPVVLTHPDVTPVSVKLPFAAFIADDIAPVMVRVFCAPGVPAETMVTCIALPCPITPMVSWPEITVPGPKQAFVSLMFRFVPVSVLPLWFIDIVKVRNWVEPEVGGTAVLFSVTDQKPLAGLAELRVPPLPPQPASTRARPNRTTRAVFIRAFQAISTPDVGFVRQSNEIEMNSGCSEMSCFQVPLIDFWSMNSLPQLTLGDFERAYAERHLLHAVVSHWAAEKPHAEAIVNADRNQQLDWAAFDQRSTTLAMQLVRMGFRKGDYFATCLPLSTEHILLEYACFRIGAIVTPLDLRAGPQEITRALNVVRAKAFAFLGQTPGADFRELGNAVRRHCPYVQHLIQFSPEAPVEGAIACATLARQADQLAASSEREEAESAYREGTAAVAETDGALAIFTTGSTGSPKPALLSHRNITCQNMCLSAAFFGPDSRTLVNLPASHVGGQTELLMSTLFGGGTAVILETFDPARSLRAIQDHRINKVGQIPAMFNFEWRLKDYAQYDLSRLDFVAYGGQQVSRTFAARLGTMASHVGTGLGLTEAAGFCTYILEDAEHAEQLASTLGHSMPVYPVSIRHPMRDDGTAGDELPDGEIGHVCFRGPQTFLGYVDDPEATAKAISREGYLYTGDLGFKDERGLHLSGRAQWIIKTAGYQVFPADVENHIAALETQVAMCAVVGVEHPTISEAVVAFVEKKPDVELTRAELERHARTLPSYMRPRRYVILEPGQMPLNRSVKPDYVKLAEMAKRSRT